MKNLRKFIFWCHLPVGLIASLFIFIISLTGALLAFEPQITDFAERGMRTIQVPSKETPKLSYQTLIAKVKEARPNAKPSGLIIQSDPSLAVTVNLGREGILYVNPYTGELLGEGSKTVRAFFQTTTDLHRWFATQGETRAIGKAIKGIVNLAFFFMILSGLYLWWPRAWTRQQIKAVTIFNPKLKNHAKNFNWHNVIGFWSSSILIFITVTGMIMSYDWAENLLYTLTGSEKQTPQTASKSSNQPVNKAPTNENTKAQEATVAPAKTVEVLDNLDKFYEQAQKQASPKWQIMNLRLPANSKGAVTVFINNGNYWQRSQLTLDGSTAEVIKWEPYESYNLGRRLRLWTQPIHTGEALGFITQAIAGLAALGGVFLVWTGLALTLHRFRAWFAKRSKPAKA